MIRRPWRDWWSRKWRRVDRWLDETWAPLYTLAAALLAWNFWKNLEVLL